MYAKTEPKPGRLDCVGIGMVLGAHLSPRCRNMIEAADVVFVAVSDGMVEQWVRTMNDDVRSLQPYYPERQSRMVGYRRMVEAMLDEVRQGKDVCGAFYGHPGVFAWAPHKAIEKARAEGFDAHMEPGISAEDCLYADLGIDPGRLGCQHMEASQFMFYKRVLDTGGYVILWQIGMAGDRSLTRFETDAEYLNVLVGILAETYSLDHPVIVYETPNIPVMAPRIDHLTLEGLVQAELNERCTLVIPPAKQLAKNQWVIDRLNQIESKKHKELIWNS